MLLNNFFNWFFPEIIKITKLGKSDISFKYKHGKFH